MLILPVLFGQRKNIGFILSHIDIDKEGLPFLGAMRLYLKPGYKHPQGVKNIWAIVEEIAREIKLNKITQASSGSANSMQPPKDYKKNLITLKRLQPLQDGRPMYADDAIDINQRNEVERYVKKLQLLQAENASGYQLPEDERQRIMQAVKKSKVLREENAETYQQLILKELLSKINLEDSSSLREFILNSQVTLVTIRPQQQGLYKYGLNVNLGEYDKPGRDIYATFEIENDKTTLSIRIYISEYTAASASEAVIREIIAHELYEAYQVLAQLHPQDKRFASDIDLGIAINKEIEKAKSWEETLSQEEREDLGLISNDTKAAHTRARAFARLIGESSREGRGSQYTGFLRESRNRSLKLEEAAKQFDKPLAEVMPLEKAFELMAYMASTKREPLGFLKGILEIKKIILWNYATFSYPVFSSMVKLIGTLIKEGRVNVIGIPIGQDNQPLLDSYLSNGIQAPALLEAINNEIFPSSLSGEFKEPGVWLEFLNLVFMHNLMHPDKNVRLLALASLNSVPEVLEASIKNVKEQMRGEEKAIILKYYSLHTSQEIKQDSGIYHLLHIDPEIGFIGDKINSLSYALTYLMPSRGGDFILEVSGAPFKQEQIQPLSEGSWQEEAIKALQAVKGKPVSQAEIRQIRQGFALWAQQAEMFNYFRLYDAVVVSLPGDEGGERQKAPEPEVLEPELVPIRIRPNATSAFGLLAPLTAGFLPSGYSAKAIKGLSSRGPPKNKITSAKSSAKPFPPLFISAIIFALIILSILPFESALSLAPFMMLGTTKNNSQHNFLTRNAEDKIVRLLPEGTRVVINQMLGQPLHLLPERTNHVLARHSVSSKDEDKRKPHFKFPQAMGDEDILALVLDAATFGLPIYQEHRLIWYTGREDVSRIEIRVDFFSKINDLAAGKWYLFTTIQTGFPTAGNRVSSNWEKHSMVLFPKFEFKGNKIKLHWQRFDKPGFCEMLKNSQAIKVLAFRPEVIERILWFIVTKPSEVRFERGGKDIIFTRYLEAANGLNLSTKATTSRAPMRELESYAIERFNLSDRNRDYKILRDIHNNPSLRQAVKKAI